MANEPTKLPRRPASKWPVLMEGIENNYVGAFRLPSWKVIHCTSTKNGEYLVRIVPTEGKLIEPFNTGKPLATP